MIRISVFILYAINMTNMMMYSLVFDEIDPHMQSKDTHGEQNTWCWTELTFLRFPGSPDRGPDLPWRAVQGRWEPEPSV